MAKDMQCPICDADIPLEGNEKAGEVVVCSYCGTSFKMLQSKGKWVLEDEFEE